MSQTGQVHLQLPGASRLFTPAVVTIIIILSIAGSVVLHFATAFCSRWLILSTRQAFHGYLWQFFTYPFFFTNPVWLLMDLTVILVIGSAVEREWGAKTFFCFWLLTSLLSGLGWVLVGLIVKTLPQMFGSAACGYALIFIFGELYHGRQFMLMMNVVDARVVAWMMLGMGAVLSLFAPFNLLYLLGVPAGWGFLKVREKLIYGTARSYNRSYDDQGFVDID